MRRLATLCFPALLCAVSAPPMAANDGVIVFVPPETQLSEYASGAAPASVPAPAPTRGRYGGGFIEALLTGGARSSRRWPPQLRASPRTWKPSPSRNSAGRKSTTRGRKRRERLSSTRPTGSCFSSSRTEKRCATASASGVPASNGRASSGSAASPNGRTGRRRPRCCCAVPTCRAIWRAAPIIRSARERSISGPRSTAFTAPTSRRPSATTSRQAASG